MSWWARTRRRAAGWWWRAAWRSGRRRRRAPRRGERGGAHGVAHGLLGGDDAAEVARNGGERVRLLPEQRVAAGGGGQPRLHHAQRRHRRHHAQPLPLPRHAAGEDDDDEHSLSWYMNVQQSALCVAPTCSSPWEHVSSRRDNSGGDESDFLPRDKVHVLRVCSTRANLEPLRRMRLHFIKIEPQMCQLAIIWKDVELVHVDTLL